MGWGCVPPEPQRARSSRMKARWPCWLAFNRVGHTAGSARIIAGSRPRQSRMAPAWFGADWLLGGDAFDGIGRARLGYTPAPRGTLHVCAPTALPAMLTVLPEMHTRFLTQRLAGDLDGVHVLRAGDTAWAFRITGKTVTYLASAPTTYDTCLSTDAESLILLSMGRANMEAKRHSGTLTISGEATKAQQLCETLFRTL